MNLREVQLSSRAVIPVALALPINRDPAAAEHENRERERRMSGDQQRPGDKGPVCFYL